jgi:Uma2 family endonuclease
MNETLIKVGPADHGRRMTLHDFEHAEGAEGCSYELSRGVIVVDVPDGRHAYLVDAMRAQLYAYRATSPDSIRMIAAGSDCKILLSREESERHPDVAVYKTNRPDGDELWAQWVPEIVIEMVSPSSAHRDYQEKPEEYLRFGVSEYWIVDADKGEAGEILVLSRSAGGWNRRVVRTNERYKTWLLPGFELDVAAIFAAAR